MHESHELVYTPKRAANPHYTVREEIANAITHGIGVPLSLAALVVMVVYASLAGNPWLIVGCAVFGTALTVTYLASCLYHALPYPHLKQPLRVFDHCAIYLLIAGTYTPFLLSFRGTWGWTLFALVWSAAIAGIVFKLFFTGKWDRISTYCYVAMGWVVVLAIQPTFEALGLPTLTLLAFGGLAYTGGVVFYLWEKLPYNHAIWHLFVLSGSLFHFLAVFLFLLPAV